MFPIQDDQDNFFQNYIAQIEQQQEQQQQVTRQHVTGTETTGQTGTPTLGSGQVTTQYSKSQQINNIIANDIQSGTPSLSAPNSAPWYNSPLNSQGQVSMFSLLLAITLMAVQSGYDQFKANWIIGTQSMASQMDMANLTAQTIITSGEQQASGTRAQATQSLIDGCVSIGLAVGSFALGGFLAQGEIASANAAQEAANVAQQRLTAAAQEAEEAAAEGGGETADITEEGGAAGTGPGSLRAVDLDPGLEASSTDAPEEETEEAAASVASGGEGSAAASTTRAVADRGIKISDKAEEMAEEMRKEAFKLKNNLTKLGRADLGTEAAKSLNKLADAVDTKAIDVKNAAVNSARVSYKMFADMGSADELTPDAEQALNKLNKTSENVADTSKSLKELKSSGWITKTLMKTMEASMFLQIVSQGVTGIVNWVYQQKVAYYQQTAAQWQAAQQISQAIETQFGELFNRTSNLSQTGLSSINSYLQMLADNGNTISGAVSHLFS